MLRRRLGYYSVLVPVCSWRRYRLLPNREGSVWDHLADGNLADLGSLLSAVIPREGVPSITFKSRSVSSVTKRKRESL
ncbi:hypothetical protein E4T56_gene5180 [Termitomyces sp. T112]|nr:hypothetical protein E4T56_gene5180 [Termitomyces sp. T112]